MGNVHAQQPSINTHTSPNSNDQNDHDCRTTLTTSQPSGRYTASPSLDFKDFSTNQRDKVEHPRDKVKQHLQVDPDDTKHVEILEIWTRPLASVASSFGGRHSFIVCRLTDRTYKLIEKHYNGGVEFQTLTRKNVVNLALKKANKIYTKDKVAFRASKTLKENITWGKIRKISQEHHGGYDIHESNCHRLTASVWNASVCEKKELSAPLQSTLSKMASLIGIGASVRQDANRNGAPEMIYAQKTHVR
jgi:hypothetical protein